MKKFKINVLIRTLMLAASIGLLFFLFFTSGYKATLIILGFLISYQIYSLLRYVDITNKELARFLQSIKYADFSQSFTHKQLGSSFNELYQSFNDVIGEFQKTRSEKEEQYKFVNTVMQHVGVGLITFTSDGKVHFINNSAKKIFRINQLYSIEHLDKIHTGMNKILRNLKPGEKVTVKITADSETQQLIVYAAEFKLKNRNYTLLSLQNILPELEEKEMQAWQNLIRVLTHEIMNSVTPISSLAGTVNHILNGRQEYDQETKDDIKLAVETIQKRSEALVHFVDVYRSLARTPEPGFEIFRIKDLFNRVYKLLEPELNNRNVVLKTEVVPDKLDLTADPELVEQVLINLILNAIQSFSNHKNAEIKLAAYLDQWGKISLTVSDNGPGIPEELHEKIFIPFFTTKKEGSGIGLSLSRQIMRSHGGSIRVSSKQEEGTTFILRF
jgi:two-component system, NtrC family, nitrogen regulation sensor histidine kinase NtrY